VVLLDKRRAWRYLHLVAALNWWKAAFYRHAWGDKDTWVLAAVALEHADLVRVRVWVRVRVRVGVRVSVRLRVRGRGWSRGRGRVRVSVS
jgi:hypothetical protein